MECFMALRPHRRHPIRDGTGAAMVGGRWSCPGRPVIHAPLSYVCAMLEILVHANIGRIPAMHACAVAEIPDSLAVARHDAQSAGSDHGDRSVARGFGGPWLQREKCAVLRIFFHRSAA